MATAQRSYKNFIEARGWTNPCTVSLAQYVKQARASATDRVVLIDYPADGEKPGVSREVSASELSQLLAIPSASGLAGGIGHPGRVLLVENIHPQTLVLLGETLDVDPVFFAGHIKTDFQDVEKAPPPPSLAFSPSQIAERGFLHVNYQLVIDLGQSAMFNTSPYALKTDSNTPRNVRRLPPLSGRQLALARGCCSMLLLSRPHGSWICLILVDPTLKTVVENTKAGGILKHPSKPLHGGFEDFTQPASFSSFQSAVAPDIIDSGLQDRPRRGSMLDSLVHYLVNHNLHQRRRRLLRGLSQPPAATTTATTEPPGFLDLAYYPIRIGLAEWVLYTHLTSRYVKFYEYSLRDVHNRLHDSDVVDLQRWRRRCRQSQHKLDLVAEFVRHWLPHEEHQHQQQTHRQQSPWDLVLRDVAFVQSQLVEHGRSLEQMIPVATSMVQLLDSRRSIAQSANVTRLTYVALVFVPLSWVAGLFSMSEQYSPSGEGGQFWVYWATALPLLLAVLFVSALSAMWRPLEGLRWLRRDADFFGRMRWGRRRAGNGSELANF